MSRYARLLKEGMARYQPECGVVLLQLGLPVSVLRAIPRRLAVWVHHGWLAASGRGRLGRLRTVAIHVLDGSHAYVARDVERSRLVVTCHDVIPHLQAVGVLNGAPGRLARRVVDASLDVVRSARQVLADSGRTAGDLGDRVGVDAGRIRVLPPPLDPLFAAAPADTARGDVAPRVMLHVGGNASYKNRGGAVRVFRLVRASADVTLVLAGPPPDAPLQRLIASLPDPSAVTLRVNPTDQELLSLYRRASLFVFPSRYEGFGWPVAEAMACGCPVVCSNAGSLPEVAGGAALMAEPDDEPTLASHCLRLLESRETAEHWRLKGLENARRFSLEGTARALADIYACL